MPVVARLLATLIAVVSLTVASLAAIPPAHADTALAPSSSLTIPGGGLSTPTIPSFPTAGAVVTPLDAWGVASSALTLTQIDVLTGELRPWAASSSSNPDTLAVLDLAAQGQLAINTQRIADAARQEAERRRAAEERTRAESVALSSNGQVEIGPDGCPTRVPSGTLRSGAESIGAYELCSRSVAAAATPEAAKAIKWAFSKLGTKYACHGMANQFSARLGPHYYDCSSLVASAYRHGAGLTRVNPGQSTRDIMPWGGVPLASYYELVPAGQGRPGDLVAQRSCTSPPCSYQHVVMLLSNGYQLHTNSCGDVAHVTRFAGFSASNYAVTRRVNPAKAR